MFQDILDKIKALKAKALAAWKVVRENLTLIYAALMAAVGTLQVSDIYPMIPANLYPYATLIAPVALAVLRMIEAHYRARTKDGQLVVAAATGEVPK